MIPAPSIVTGSPGILIRWPTTERVNRSSRLDNARRNGDGSGFVRFGGDRRGRVRASGPRNFKDWLPIPAPPFDLLSLPFLRHEEPRRLNPLNRERHRKERQRHPRRDTRAPLDKPVHMLVG